MEPIVLQLQQDAAGSAVSATELLRKALIVARKLSDAEFQQWIRRESEGYTSVADLPAYRRLSGQLRAQNPYRGWIPVMSDDAEFVEAASQAPILQPIGELEELCAAGKGLMIRRAELERPEFTDRGVILPIYLHLSTPRVQSIFHSVRTVVLNWSLDLEERGIKGEGLAFSPSEKEAARQGGHSVSYFFGNGSIAQFSQGANSVQSVHAGLSSADIEGLVKTIQRTMPAASQSPELGELLDQIQELMRQPNPPKSKVRNALQSIKDFAVAGGAAIEVVHKASELIAQVT